MNLTLRPGRYYAGINRPWFVSDAAVREALAEYGIGQVSFHDREREPIPITSLSDEWDEWVEAVYNGPARTIETSKRWAWLIHVPFSAYSPAGSTSPSPSFTRPWPVVPPSVYLPVGVIPPSVYEPV